MNVYRQVYFAGIIVSVILIILGITALTYFYFYIQSFSATHGEAYIFGGIVAIIVGSLMLWQTCGPKEQLHTQETVCLYCGALVKEDATICEKCKQPIADN